MTAAERVLAHFDRISEAPDAIPRLRRFVLDLAVRGKLVGQDSNDEPAAELVERIQSEKRADKTTTSREFATLDEAELPFQLPNGWTWVPIGRVTSGRGQVVPSETFTYIDVTAIDKEAGRIAEPNVLLAGDAPSRARKRAQKDDVLYSCVRPYLLNVAVIDRDFIPPPIVSTAFAVLNGFGLVLSKYLWIALRSPAMVEQVESKMRGQAYPAINDSDFMALPLPLPPLLEQRRIVAKVDELMALCDRLEAAQKERENRRDRLVGASLARLNQPPDAPSFREHARFHLKHLPRLATTRAHIQQLRQTIFNQAVAGRLVPQDPNDGPTSQLLASIRQERQRLSAAGEVGKSRVVQPLGESDIPFSAPGAWVWVRFGTVILESSSGWSPRSEGFVRQGDAWGVLKVSAVSWDRFDQDENKQLMPGVVPPTSAIVRKGDFLISRANTSQLVAKAVVVDVEPGKLILSDKLVRLRLAAGTDPRFVLMVNNHADYARSYYATHASGTSLSMKNVTRDVIYALPIPLPPLSEQHRIVAKVRELMAVCDQLEAQLDTASAERQRLLESLLSSTLHGNPQEVVANT